MLTMDQNTCHLPAPSFMKRTIRAGIRDNLFQNYPPPMGYDWLHEQILDDIGLSDTDAKVCITDGAGPAIYQILTFLKNSNGRFIDSDPAWKWPREYVKEMPQFLVPGKIKPKHIQGADVINIVNPQNPIGHTYTVDELIEIKDAAKENGAWILYDCTYKDFLNEYYAIYQDYPEKTFITLSYSKSPGLAGLRTGAVVCSPDNMKAVFGLRGNQLGSSSIGQLAAGASLHTKSEWLPKLKKTTIANRDYIIDNLKDMPVEFPYEFNFGNSLWIDLPQHNSTDLWKSLSEKGILVRDGIYYKSLDNPERQFFKVTTSVPKKWCIQFTEEFKALL